MVESSKSHMEISVYTPTEKLAPFIALYRIIRSDKGTTNRVLPSTSLALAFRFQGSIIAVNDGNSSELSAVTFSGLRKSVRFFSYAPATASLIVQFTETGAACFFGLPIFELFEQNIPLAHLIPASTISIMEERLAAADSDRTRIAIIDAFLCSNLANEKTDPLVANAISKIYALNGIARIKPLARELYISQDALEKRFRKVTGTSPKQFSFIVRMRSVLAQFHQKTSMLHLALENGFYDQPHFIKEFKTFTGVTPTEFLKSDLYW